MTHVLLKLLINILLFDFWGNGKLICRDTREGRAIKKRVWERHFAMNQGRNIITLFFINKGLIGSGVKEQGLWCPTSPDFES